MNELSVAIQLAREAGDILRRGWSLLDYRIDHKGPTNPVTAIDCQSELLIVEGLRRAFPDHGILAEEGTAASRPHPVRWIIDPLDGTVNYIHHIPMVAVSLGLEMDGEVILGVVYNPITDELFVGEQGCGATLNGMAMHVSTTHTIGEAVLASGFPYEAWDTADDNTQAWRSFVKTALTVRCDGSAALDLCQVACGRLDGYWERGLSAWDIAAGSVIVREAGGWVGDFQLGNNFLQRREIIAANYLLAKDISRMLVPEQTS